LETLRQLEKAEQFFKIKTDEKEVARKAFNDAESEYYRAYGQLKEAEEVHFGENSRENPRRLKRFLWRDSPGFYRKQFGDEIPT